MDQTNQPISTAKMNHDTHSAKIPQKQKQAKKTRKIILLCIELLILAVLGIILYFMLVPKASGEDEQGNQSAKEAQIAESIDPSAVGIPTEVANDPVRQAYRNIALFGVDVNREADNPQDALIKGFRSDSIMIASINLDTKEIKLVSVFRDTYLNIGDGDYAKINGAYRLGGAEQAIKALNTNLDMDITDFITVGYAALTKAIDGLGGVWIDVDQEEISHLNNYQIDVARVMGIDDYPSEKYPQVKKAGYQLLNGMQATAYCRIRATLGWDYKRTQRQRDVLKAMQAAAQEASATDLIKVFNTIDEYIYTSLAPEDVLEFLPLAASGDVHIAEEESTFPLQKKVWEVNLGKGGAAVVVPNDLVENVIELHKFLYGEDMGYEPPNTVKQFDQEIKNKTKEYVEAEYGPQ